MFLLILGGVILTLFFLDYFFLKPKLDFPMPGFRLPILGHSVFIGNKPHQTFEAWGSVCGPVYMIQALNKTIIIVNDNEIFQQMCDNGNFEGRNRSVRFDILACAEKDGIPKEIFSQDANARHQHLKHFTLGLVDRMRHSTYFSELIEHTQENMRQAILGKSADSVIVEPYDTVTKVVYNYSLCGASGVLLSMDSPTSQKLVRMAEIFRVCLSTEAKSLEMFPFLKYFGNSTYTGLKEVESIVNEIFQELKTEVERNGVNQGLTSGFLTDSERPNEPDDVLASVLVGNVIGAGEPTVTALYGIILILASHQEEQERIRREIKSKKLSRPFVPGEDCQSPYIEAFLMESLRYLTPNPMIIRRALQDTSLTGCSVPKDTSVIINLYAGHHDPTKYKDPWVFRPERFLGKDGNLLPESDPVRRNFKAYGGFKKKCLALPVIKDVLFSIVASLVDSFDISGVAGIDVPHDQRSWQGMAVAAFPRRCQMKFMPRN